MNSVEASELKIGQYVFLSKRPCKIIELTKSKTGKHGHCKVNVQGVDVITGNKYIDVFPGHIKLFSFELQRGTYQLNNIEEDTVTYMNDTEESTIRIDVESDIYKEIKQYFDDGCDITVSIIKAPVMPKDNDNVTEYEEIIESYKVNK